MSDWMFNAVAVTLLIVYLAAWAGGVGRCRDGLGGRPPTVGGL